MKAENAAYTILVVEDYEAMRVVAVKILQMAGYRVLEAGSGKQAVQLWNGSPRAVDLLIADLALGGDMNGDAVARLFRKLNPDLPVIFFTANSPETCAENFALVDHSGYLSKPSSPAALLNAVQLALANR